MLLLLLGVGVFEPALTAQTLDDPELRQAVCAPRVVTGFTPPALTITGSQDGATRSYFGTSDTLLLSGGRGLGLDVGQTLAVRRVVTSRLQGPNRVIVHTAGVVRVVALDDDAAISEVLHACDEIRTGDYLEPFSLGEPPAFFGPGRPDYEHPGRIVYGPDGRALITRHQYFVIDLGLDDGIEPGQRLTVFRAALAGGTAITELAEAIVVTVERDTATARLTRLRDVVEVGDRVAPQR